MRSVCELHRATDLSQHLVATERHLWLKLSNIKRKDINFLMDDTIFPLASSTMLLNWLSRDFRNQLNKQLHSRNSSPAILISPGLLSPLRAAPNI